MLTFTPGGAFCNFHPTPKPSVCGDMLAFLPGDSTGTADPSNPHLVDPLFVFLPGTNGTPHDNRKLLKMAAFAGYRTIGLSYWNMNEIREQCQDIELDTTCQNNYFDECAYEVRWERLGLGDDPDTVQLINHQHTIGYRLVQMLEELHDWDLLDGVDDWGFDTYCHASLGGCSTAPGSVPWVNRIRWDRVVLGGFSQGAGYPQLLSLHQELDGIVSIDGGNDRCDGSANVASHLPDLVSLWGASGGASDGEGEFAALHEQSTFAGMVSPEIVPDAFTYVQLDTSVHEVDTTALPLTRNVARTNQNWPTGCGAHGSMAVRQCMPTSATRTLTPASTSAYLPDLNLFATYVEGFCDARTP